jgi:hypothetical protein
MKVGGNVITLADIRIRERVIATRTAVTEGLTEGAYAQLLQGFLFVELLATMGHPVTDEMLDRELRRIDETTHDPQGLATLKSACGGGESMAYRRIGILPDFANRVFAQQVYPRMKELHAERLAEAETLLRELCAAAPSADKLAVLPPNSRFERSISLFSLQFGFEPIPNPGDPPLHKADSATGEARWQVFEKDYLSPVALGTFCPSVIDMDDRFVLLRWIAWEDEARHVRRVEQVWLPKRSASDYFVEKAASVPVWIADAAVAGSIREKVTWARRLSWRQP